MNVFSACVKTLLAVACFFSLAVIAEPASAPAASIPAMNPMASAGRVLFFLLFIIAFIFFLAWLLQKTNVLRSLNQGQSLKTVAVLSLGVKEKVAVIQVGEQQVLVGITAHTITPLMTLDEPLQPAQSSQVAQTTSFADLLKKAVRS